MLSRFDPYAIFMYPQTSCDEYQFDYQTVYFGNFHEPGSLPR